MKHKKKIAVVGAGILGCFVAINLARNGFKVHLIERADRILTGSSRNNTRRLHRGYHYPRSRLTATECRDAYSYLTKMHPEFIGLNKNHLYILSRYSSKTTFAEFKMFCNELELPYSNQELGTLNAEQIDGAVSVVEGVFNMSSVVNYILRQIIEHDIITDYNQDVLRCACHGLLWSVTTQSGAEDFDGIVNCSYTDFNLLRRMLGLTERPLLFEQTVIPIVSSTNQPFGCTILDGPFVTLMPSASSDKSFLYHVEDSVISRVVDYSIPLHYFAAPDDKTVARVYDSALDVLKRFGISIEDGALTNSLYGPRVILPNVDSTDERPTIIDWHTGNAVSILSGKIDRSIVIAYEIAERFEDNLL